MRWRLVVLGLLAITLAVGFVVCTLTAADMASRGQLIYNNAQQQQPTQKQMDHADALFRQASALQALLIPAATGALVCALAIPAVLGRRWQLREAA